jgi:hypothetical protein
VPSSNIKLFADMDWINLLSRPNMDFKAIVIIVVKVEITITTIEPELLRIH